jgi:hypothetical protein
MKIIPLAKSNGNFPPYLDYSHFKEILVGINAVKYNALEDMEWGFVDVKVNFSVIDSLQFSCPFMGKDESLNPVLLAKIMFLSCIEGVNSPRVIRGLFDSIVKTFYFMVENETSVINSANIHEYLFYIIMHGVNGNGVYKRLEPIGYGLFNSGITPTSWQSIIKEHSLPKIGFVGSLSNVYKKELKSAIEILSAGDLTYRDWKEGGSFNHLTLDYGRYYVEHCDDFFHRNINIAIALQNTINNSVYISKMAGFNVSKNYIPSDILPGINHFLSGKQVDDLKSNYILHRNKSMWHELKKCTFEFFQNELRVLSIVDELSGEKFVKKLSAINGIDEPNSFQKEWLKVLVDAECDIQFERSSAQLIKLAKQEVQCIKEIVGQGIDVDKTLLVIQEEIESIKLIMSCREFVPTLEFYKENGIEGKGLTSTNVYNYIKLVENAGITSFVSLTGWRESEYGFSLNDILINPNRDLIDQYLYPIRYDVKWVVPKTNGETKLQREILRSAYRRAVKLSILVNAKDDDPCLYSCNRNKTNPKHSGNTIKYVVGSMWSHFVKNYIPFKNLELIDERKSLLNNENRTRFDDARLEDLSTRYLTDKWETLERNQSLNEAYSRALKEFDRVSFFLKQDDRRNIVWEYKEGTVNPEYELLIDKYLSDEKKQAIRDLKSKDDVNSEFTRIIISEIIQDCLYPTPHAFRHMWAESVLRRFDGDVGWMIRSNFKHISQNMWLAYIRNKENRRLNDRVKHNVVSSILKNYIRKRETDALGNVGEFGDDYAGALNKKLRRLYRHTKTWSLEELDKAIEHFALTEIDDIKSSPWGFCILPKRHQDKAKCAESGIPQRQNASPAFCLGCPNNLTQSGNIEGILLGVSNDMNVICNPRVPDVFRRASYETVKNALAHLKKLKASSEVLTVVQSALKQADAIFIENQRIKQNEPTE